MLFRLAGGPEDEKLFTVFKKYAIIKLAIYQPIYFMSKTNIKKFYRSRTDRFFLGVCGGLAEFFQVDANLVRAVFILLAFANGLGCLLYISLAIIIPLKPKGLPENGGDHTEHHSGLLNIVGLFVVIIGVLLLAKMFFPFVINWNILYSIIIIILGLFLIIKKDNLIFLCPKLLRVTAPKKLPNPKLLKK